MKKLFAGILVALLLAAGYVYSDVSLPGGGGSAGAGGSTTQVQFNDSGVLGGDAGLTYSKTIDYLGVGGVTFKGWNGVYKGIQLGQGGSLVSGASTESTAVASNWYFDGAGKYIANGYAARLMLSSGQISSQVAVSGSADGAVSWLTPFVIGATENYMPTGYFLNYYNTADQATNYERGFLKWDSNIFKLGSEKGGSGTLRAAGVYVGTSSVSVNGAGTVALGTSTGTVNFDGSTIYPSGAAVSLGSAGGAFTNIVQGTGGSHLHHNLADMLTNYERAYMKWDSNIYKIGTEKGGSGTERALNLYNVGTIYGTASSAMSISHSDYLSVATAGIDLGSTGWLSLKSAATYFRLHSATGVPFSFTNATNPITTAAPLIAHYNTVDTISTLDNYERGYLNWNTNVWDIGTNANGTGTARNMSITPGGGTLTINAATVLKKPATAAGAGITLSAAQVSNTVINNAGQGPNDRDNNLPAAAAGYSFTAVCSETVSSKYWKFTRNGSDTIVFNGTAGQTYFSIASPTQGAMIKCVTAPVATSGLLTTSTLSIGATKTQIKTTAFTFDAAGAGYAKGEVDGTAPSAATTPQNKYGALALDIGADGTIDQSPAPNNGTTGYDSGALAIAALPAVAANHVRIGYVTAMHTDAGGFVWGTTDLDAAGTTVTYTSGSAYTPGQGWICNPVQGTWTSG